jgi:hypothetical protein
MRYICAFLNVKRTPENRIMSLCSWSGNVPISYLEYSFNNPLLRGYTLFACCSCFDVCNLIF